MSDQKSYMFRASTAQPQGQPVAAENTWTPWYGNTFGGNYVTPQSSQTGEPQFFIDAEAADASIALAFATQFSMPVGVSVTYAADNTADTLYAVQADLITDNSTAGTDTFRGMRCASYGFAFDGTNFDRVRTLPSDADAQAAAQVGLQGAVTRGQLFNATTWDRANSLPSNADAQAAAQTGLAGTVSRLQAFNGTTWDRIRTNSAATLSGTTQQYAQQVADPGEWSVNHTPAANTQATISKAAGAAGVRHVVKSITGTLIGLTGAAETTVLVNLRDGATGVGTILWSTRLLVIPSGQTGFTLQDLNIVSSAATAITLEFAAAGGASTLEAVAMTGYSTI